MVAFSTVKVGDVLYDHHRHRMGNTTMTRMGTWTVYIKEVDQDRRRALVSWNGNAATWWGETRLKQLRRSDPRKTKTMRVTP